MFRNYLIITFRNLRRSGSYSLINIIGLSVGITCSLLIMLWVFDELSFNLFHPKANRLYKVMTNATYDGKVNTWGAVPLVTVDAVKSESAHIVNSCVVDWGNDHLLTVGEHRLRKRSHFVTPEFLSMFEFPLIKGNKDHALDNPGSILISESMAKALFGDKDPINQLVRLDDQHDQRVTGVLADVPKNSTFQFEYLLPWGLYETESWVKQARTSWDNYSFGVYVELDNEQSRADAEKAIKDLPGRHEKSDVKKEFVLYPLTQWKLYSVFENGKPVTGGIEYVRLFSIIASFILIIACINFMNLATARSERRAKEVGIRKSVGSSRRELIFRFIGESVFIAFIAFAIAVLITELVLPSYNNLVQKQLHINYLSVPFWLFALGLIFFTGIVSGSYPAFYLSSFKPVKVLKGKILQGSGGSLPRKILVTMQFGFSILLMIGTLVVYQQIQHVKNRDIGFQQQNLITIHPTDEIKKNFQALKQDLLQSGVVNSVAKSSSDITNIDSWSFLGWPGKPEEQRVLFTAIGAEYDYAKTMGIKVLMGRDFSEDFKSDSNAVIINRAALDLMGLKDPIGQQLTFHGGKKVELVGVLENTIMASPTEAVGPMFIQFDPNWFNSLAVRLEKTDDLPASLKTIEEIVKKHNPAYPFEYAFADVEFQKKFGDILLTGRLANLFASLAILITGLGLFGLASFTAEQRTREIGIRKVLGASVMSLVSLMTRDFSRLVILAFFVAAPLAGWLLNKFLERYPYRIEIPWWVFPLTGAVALGFALIIVITQSLRAAQANPVKSLRTE